MLDNCFVDEDCLSSDVLSAVQESLVRFQNVLENTEYTKNMPKAALEDLEYGYQELCKVVCILQVQSSKKIRSLLRNSGA